ncbi:serine hydrolase [Streptomyces tanashiensis]
MPAGEQGKTVTADQQAADAVLANRVDRTPLAGHAYTQRQLQES